MSTPRTALPVRVTAGMAHVLRIMRANEDTEDGDLVGESGQWWVGNEPVPQSIVDRLLLARAISLDYCCTLGGYALYTLNSTGRGLLLLLEDVREEKRRTKGHGAP